MSIWANRRARALALANDRPHAADMLRCYAEVAQAQESIAARMHVQPWMTVASDASADGPALRLPRLPLEDMLPLFADFLGQLSGTGTEVMTARAHDLMAAGPTAQRAALENELAPDPIEGDVDSFHARAFVEAVATTLAGRVLPTASAIQGTGPARCRVCGAPPLVATLRDLPGALGSRALVCSRCASEQRLQRLTCAQCGESNAERLHVHTAESVTYLRIDECSSCAHYIKTVDLRRRGDAVPLVEDLATPELDLWAGDRGLTKGRKNLFGL
ncbi:MAG: formate dehydrogenase accessory protein FdhE [Longimicrobiales bacterium]